MTAWESRRLLLRGEGEWRRPGPHPYPVVRDFIVVIVVITGVADSILVVVLLPGVWQVGAVILGRENAYDGSVPVPLIQPEPGAGPPDAAHGPEMLCSPTASCRFSWEDKKLSIFLGGGGMGLFINALCFIHAGGTSPTLRYLGESRAFSRGKEPALEHTGQKGPPSSCLWLQGV